MKSLLKRAFITFIVSKAVHKDSVLMCGSVQFATKEFQRQAPDIIMV